MKEGSFWYKYVGHVIFYGLIAIAVLIVYISTQLPEKKMTPAEEREYYLHGEPGDNRFGQ